MPSLPANLVNTLPLLLLLLLQNYHSFFFSGFDPILVSPSTKYWIALTMLRHFCSLQRRIKPSSYLLSFSKGHHALASMPTPSTDWNTHHEFFHHTSYRWVLNEQHEMEMRNVQFDMNNLARIAAESMGFQECKNVEKLDEGCYNKVFLFTMNDGSEVVGKVPSRNAGRPHFTTASEVATMDFVRHLRWLWKA